VRDSLSLDPLGTHAFVLGFTAWVFCEGRAHRGRLEGAPRLLLTFLAGLVAGWAYLLRLVPLGTAGLTGAEILAVVPGAAWTTAFAAALFPLLDHFGVFDDLLGRTRGVPA
jgi:hypothetical protein